MVVSVREDIAGSARVYTICDGFRFGHGRFDRGHRTMSDSVIAAERMARHRLARPGPADAADVVGWFGAVQAQDYGAARWALALRMRGAISGEPIERALDEGRVLRTHLMRPTWHFVAAADIRWLLDLTAPRVRPSLGFGRKYYGLTDALHRRATRVIERALERDACLTRPEIADRLARVGIAATGVPLALIAMSAELDGVICSGPRRGKRSTYMLLARRAPQARSLPRDQALAELTMRYFRSHGPATVRDFTWWSGLTTADAKRSLEIIGARSETVGGLTYWRVGARRASTASREEIHLLPVYDEYLVAYRDLIAVPRGKASWGVLPQAVVCGGQVIGTWKIASAREKTEIAIELARKLATAERHLLDRAIERYSRFAGVPVVPVVRSGRSRL
jgi:DNA glycosylase AlkZ-like